MPTTLNSGLQLPDKGSVDWYSSMQNNYNLLDTHLENTNIHVTAEDKANWNSKQGSLSQAQLDAIAQVSTNTSDIATLQSGKANTSHTHSSSDITDIGDYATKTYVDTSISGLVDNAPAALDTLKELSTALNDDANFASTVTTALSAKANSADLATVATSGSYSDLTNKPTINDSTITIQKNGSTVDTFTTNGSAKTINIPVPTKTSDLTNDSNFVDTSNSAVASGITSAKVTSYDNHIADTDIHVTTADKNKWNTVTSKADDSGVVHKSGDETVGGRKTFSENITCFSNSDAKSIICKTPLSTYDSTNTVGDNTKIRFLDKNNNSISYIMQRKLTNGSTDISLNVSNTDSNNQPIEATLNFVLDSANDPRFFPGIDNTISIGRPSFRYKSFYGMNYYYGSNNVEFSTKFVTTDTNQTISGNKTFSSNVNVYNSDSATDTANIVLKNSKTERGSTTNIGEQTIFFLDKDNAQIGRIKCEVDANGVSMLTLDCTNSSDSSSGIRLRRTNTGTFLQPVYNNGCNLGTTGNRWYDVQTRAVNNLTPSSLSMPDIANKIDISSYITDLTGVSNEYTPQVNGWICVRSANTTKISILDKNTSVGTTNISPTATYLGLMIPCIANRTVYINIICTSLEFAYFIPCQGNV